MSGWAPRKLDQQSNARLLVEVCGGYLLILVVLWAPRPSQRLLYWCPVVWVVVATVLTTQSRAALGLRATHLLRSFWLVVVAALLSAATLAIASHRHTLHAPPTLALFIRSYTGYAIWAFVQQFLMMDFFLQRLLRVLRRPAYAVFVTAGIFTVAHLPNPVLTPLTLVWGLVGCWHFLRYRSLYPLALSHAILGITVAVSFPGYITHNMRVGLGYLTYHQPGLHRHRSHTDHIASTHVCVMADAARRLS